MHIEAIIFDYDGTLVDYEEARNASLRAAASALSLKLGVQESLVADALKRVQELMERCQMLDRNVWWAEAAQRLRHRLTQADAQEITDLYWREWKKHSRPFPASATVLRSLRNLGYRLAMVANTDGKPGMKSRRIREGSLDLSVFELILIAGDDVPETKPSPQPFLAALRELGIDGEKAIYVGDDARVDVPGARESGMFTIIVSRTGLFPEVPPDVLIGKLDELQRMLASARL
ncbi:HAD family hydrolase [Tardisphaera miroshnichenkoae]